jgi:tricorn protease
MIVFVYGEDIWSVPVNGGVATRLTVNDGAERFPKFSADGTLIAFTGEYDGNGDVYVMNIYGGNIKRVTYHPVYDEVVGWHPIQNKIIFRSKRHSHNRFSRLYLISPEGTECEELMMHEAVAGSFSPDGKQIAYNRIAREHRTWKRYRGGTAQDIYLFDFETKKDQKLTDFRGTDRIPMWIGDNIYFCSDRDRILNIYSYQDKSDVIKQLTKHTDYDIRRPSYGRNKIVYELGGSLWLLDVSTEQTKRIPVEIKTDAEETRPRMVDVEKFITGFTPSPSAVRVLVTARGDIFSVPIEKGPTRNLTSDPGSREKDAVWSPDGKSIAYLSDKSGEYEIYIIDPMGKKKSIKLTNHKNGYRHTLRWSPDSKKIAFADQTLRCYFLDISTKKITEVDKANYEHVDVSLDLKPIYDFNWSPDSRYLAYSKMNADLVYQLFIYSLENKKSFCVSNGLFNEFNPVFTNDGKHLLFISNRRFDPTFCDFEWEMVYKKMAGIYALTLQKEGESLLPFKSDEEGKIEDIKNNKKIRVKIDFEGLSSRVEVIPLPRGNYRNLAVNTLGIFYLNVNEGDFNRFEFRTIPPKDLFIFLFEEREEKKIMNKIDDYKISFDGTTVLFKKNTEIGYADVTKRGIKDEIGWAGGEETDPIDVTDLTMLLDPRSEWQQIYNEAWRMERDFYYEPNMHGLNWLAMREKYGKFIPYASCRQDVLFIIGELIGELNTSHTYISGGDHKRKGEKVPIGMLGVDWQIDKNSNRYQFKKIYDVPDWSQEIIPPLAKPGLNIEAGDYLLKVNGIEVNANRNVYSYFIDLANKQVTLLVNDKPEPRGAREIIVKPLTSERTLRYLAWVEHNRKVADEMSDGQIGYIHLPDSYTDTAREFPKYYYSQTAKKGIIVDGRYNGGGLDPNIFLNRLGKKTLSYWTRRYSHDQLSPTYTTRAHMVCLTNRQAGSGGDEVPHEFKQKKMGPVIGTRTWGGLVGVSMYVDLIDGGKLTVPDYRIYNSDGKWIVENEGVTPDIIVDLSPEEMARGYDAQLMKGIEVLMKKIEKDPRPWPKHEPFPVDN